MAIHFTNKKILVAVGIIVVVVVAGAALMGVKAWNKGPEAVDKAFMKLATADTLHASAELSLNLPDRFRGRRRPLTRVNIAVEGDVARNEAGIPELTGTLKGEGRGSGTSFFFDGVTTLLHDRVAFRLTEFPVLLNPSGSLSNRWTHVNVPLLATHNPQALQGLLSTLAQQADYQGRETLEGTRVAHYSVALTADQEDELVKAFELPTSGNRALHTLARLLRANNVDALDLYINSSNDELTKITVHFVRPLPDGTNYDFANLTLSFTEYGKSVTIETPPEEARVRPEVFSNLFGTGEVQAVAQ